MMHRIEAFLGGTLVVTIPGLVGADNGQRVNIIQLSSRYPRLAA